MNQRPSQNPALRIEPGRSREFPLRKYPTAGSHPWSIQKRSCESVEPLRVDCYIVIGKRQHISLRRSNRAVQCIRLSLPRLKYIAEAAGIVANQVLNYPACVVAGVVVGDQDLPCNAGRDLRRSDTLQRGLQKTASIESAHNDCNIYLHSTLRSFMNSGAQQDDTSSCSNAL